jgi:hypothetical protein
MGKIQLIRGAKTTEYQLDRLMETSSQQSVVLAPPNNRIFVHALTLSYSYIYTALLLYLQ